MVVQQEQEDGIRPSPLPGGNAGNEAAAVVYAQEQDRLQGSIQPVPHTVQLHRAAEIHVRFSGRRRGGVGRGRGIAAGGADGKLLGASVLQKRGADACQNRDQHNGRGQKKNAFT